MLVIMAGLPGTGKSTLARAVAERVSGVVLDKDVVRAALFPAALIEYSTAQDTLVVNLMLDAAAYLLHGEPQRVVVIDGRPFGRKYQVKAVVRFAETQGWEWRLVECVAPGRVVKKRVADGQGRHLAGNRSFALYQKMKVGWEEIRCEKVVVETNRPLKNCVRQVLEHLVTNSRYDVVPGMKREPVELEPLKERAVAKYRMPKMPGPNMGPLFRKLKAVLVREAERFAVESDRPDYYRLNAKTKRWKDKRAIYFAAVRRDVGSVYFYVGALEYTKRLKVPEELSGQHRGGFCFRFERVDAETIRAVEKLVKAAVRWFRKKGWA